MNRLVVDPALRARAAHIGLARHLARVGHPERSYYSKPRTVDIDVRAAVAEAAVAEWLAVAWVQSGPDDDPTATDLGGNYEIRNLMNATNPLAVRYHEAERGATMVWTFVDPSLHYVDVIHSENAVLAWNRGAPPHYDPKTTRVISNPTEAAA